MSAALGANLWAVAVAVPAALSSLDRLRALEVVLPLVTLGAGLLAFRARPALARALLLVAYPASLAPGLDLGQGAGGLVGASAAALCALSFVAYVAATADALESAGPAIATSEGPSPVGAPIARSRGLVSRRALVFGLCTAGALATAVIAPHLDSAESRAAAFGDSAGAASTLAAVIGGLLGTLVLGAYLAPATRVERRRSPVRSGARAALYGAVALAGLAFLALR